VVGCIARAEKFLTPLLWPASTLRRAQPIGTSKSKAEFIQGELMWTLAHIKD
jgi:hypothetical protein